jgi:TonB family protein
VSRAALGLLVLAAAPLAAQDAAPPAPAPTVTRAPALAPARHPREARAEWVRTVDIPQAAKDAGHNSTATYTATVGADGQLVALTLKQSSMSPAIDAAVKARAETLRYGPATDKDGRPVEGTVDVRMEYARHDKDSPGGGIESYTCGDLVREWDWFTAANAGRGKLFWPHNAYTSLTGIEAMRQSEWPSRQARLAERATREEMWAKLIKRCRKSPARLMLEEVDHPQDYIRLVNSF